MNLPTVVHSKIAFQNSFFQIVQETRVCPERNLDDYYHMVLPMAVMVLAWSKENKLLVCREWRQSVRDWVIGLPGGRVDPGESPEKAARRELQEEAGVEGQQWRSIGVFHPFIGYTPQEIHVWSARNCSQNMLPRPEDGEFIETLWLTPQEVAGRIHEGERLDGILASCLWLEANLSVK